jgi:DNA-binding MarR family transcriptional regulator
VTADRPDFGVLIALANVTFARELQAHMTEVGFGGFTTRTGYVLRVLLAEPLSLRALADALGITSQATLKIVDAMAQGGLVDRRPSEADGRLRLVSVTDRGRDALAAARSFHERFEADLADAVGADGAARVRSALEHIAVRAPSGLPRAIRMTDD